MGRESKPVFVLVLALFLVNGCAKDNVVRKDQPVAGATNAATTVSSPAIKTDSSVASAVQGVVAGAGSQSAASSGNLQLGSTSAGTTQKTIYFDYDSYALSAEARSSLVQLADLLKLRESVRLKIEGNCDERGSDEYNLALGEKRAKAAANYLTTLGVDEARLTTISYGKEKPMAAGHDEESWVKNRRDDFVLLK